MQKFSIGSGFSTASVLGILQRWLRSGGVHPNAMIGNQPVVRILHDRLSRRFGAQRFRIVRGNLDVKERGQWRQLVHRDDIYSFVFGKEVKLAVGPDPAEKTVKVQVGVMEAEVSAGEDGELGTDDDEVDITPSKVVEYYELDDGGYECSECGKTYKASPRAEEFVKKHIAKEH